MPFPEKEIVRGELPEVLWSARLPVKGPEAVGAKVTLKLKLVPDFKVTGSANSPVLKDGPTSVPSEMVTLVAPMLVSVTAIVLVLPAITSPNRRLEGLAVSDMDWAGALATGISAIKSKA
jgi:hypothetical protein